MTVAKPLRGVVPFVSIVTPAYNVAPYLAECVRSVLDQTMTNLELLLVDDGSTDSTGAMADRFQTCDARIRVFHSDNRGVSAARNLALANARGTLIAFIDADDVWAPTFLAEQLAILARRPDVAVVTGNAFSRGGGLDGRPVRAWPTTVQDLDMIDMITRDDAVFIMSVFRREVYERIGGFDEALRHSEDFHFWFRAAVAGFRFVANPAPLGWYRRRPDSASADQSAMFSGIIRVFGKCRQLCERSHPREAAALGRRIAYWERQHVKYRVRRAILERDVHAAADCLHEWRRLHGGVPLQLVLYLCRIWPRGVLRAYLLRRHWLRQRWKPRADRAQARNATAERW